MSIISKFNQTLGFTKNETRIILFLVLIFLAGIGIKLFKSSYTSKPSYDFSSIDSEFYTRSATGDSVSSELSAIENQKDKSTGGDRSISKGKYSTSVDINSASIAELMALPGIGEGIAKNIIAYRKSNGNFKSVSDLKKVGGIGDKKFEKLLPLVTVGK
ncbi:MAG: helix-hairpin-helix domain-containing protein [Ignavibacteriales bacterium]|nr:helix-hairpin-helix domain-containing protein [Ignavibacteriales bacterium]